MWLHWGRRHYQGTDYEWPTAAGTQLPCIQLTNALDIVPSKYLHTFLGGRFSKMPKFYLREFPEFASSAQQV